MMKIVRYEKKMKAQWDNFLSHESRNDNFIFYRNYMEYHADKFEDYSLLFYDERNILLAILSANKNDNTFISHGGLTYGGFIIKKNCSIY